MALKKTDLIILVMGIVFLGLMARLVWIAADRGGVFALPADLREIGEMPSYVRMFPELYAEPIEGYLYPDGEAKMAFLTFDDGPSEHTKAVLDILKEEGVKATFFVMGNEHVAERLALLRRIVAEGHALGLHTYTHEYDKIYKSVESFLEDYNRLNDFLKESLGVELNIFRFPGGSNTPKNKKIRTALIQEMERRGYTYYDWNVSAEDSVGKVSAYSIMWNINKDVFRYDAPVILLHDSGINALTAQLLPDIIFTIQEEGYLFETLEKRHPVQFQ